MQEMCADWYSLGDLGCCLICPDAKEGCLCFNCKCKKCFYYSKGFNKGYCDLTETLKEEKKQRWIEEKNEEERIKFENSNKLKDLNQEIEKLKNIQNGILTYTYTCQKCNNWFVTLQESKIEIGKFPLCSICLSNLS
jgi:hypothetical protein